MSALGDYVHFSNENYREYGVAKKKQNPKPYSTIEVERYVKQRLIEANAMSTPALEKAAIELKRRMQRNVPAMLAKDKKMLDMDFQEKINKIYEILMKRADAGIAGGLIYGKNAFGYSGNKEKLFSKGLDKKTIEKKQKELDILNKEIDQINKNGFVSASTVQELASRFQKITNSIINEEAISDLGKLQKALLEYNFDTWSSLLYGDFGENFTAACSDAIDSASEDAVEQLLNEMVIGSQRSKISFNERELAVKLPTEKINKKQKRTIIYKNDSGEYVLGYSQNKVDVDMTVNGVELLASVKDYYDSSKVTLQSQVNLLSSLIFLNNRINDFGNHWLNMHAGQLKGRGRTNADQILEKELAFEALVSGNPLKKNIKNANVFVYMERKTGQVIVKPVSEILLKNFNLFSISPKTSNILFKNKWVGSKKSSVLNANTRIAILLAEAHQRHFKVSLQMSTLKENI